jgi:hypothetical protein
MSAIAPTVSSIGTVGSSPRRPVDVDVVGSEPAQRIAEEVLHRERPRVIAQPVSCNVAQGAELDADDNAVAVTARKRFSDQHLVVAHAVEIAGVEQVDAGIESSVDGGDALAAVGRAVKVRHSHAAKPDGEHFGSGGAKSSLFHDGTP